MATAILQEEILEGIGQKAMQDGGELKEENFNYGADVEPATLGALRKGKKKEDRA